MKLDEKYFKKMHVAFIEAPTFDGETEILKRVARDAAEAQRKNCALYCSGYPAELAIPDGE